MKPWEVWNFDFPWGTHPAIVVSNAVRVDRKPSVVIVGCASGKVDAPPGALEAVVDEADGMDWRTVVKCDQFYTVPKSDLKQRRGAVTPERRRDIYRKILQSFEPPG